jgi:hypothetical protein
MRFREGFENMKDTDTDSKYRENLTLDGNGLNIDNVSLFILRTYDANARS